MRHFLYVSQCCHHLFERASCLKASLVIRKCSENRTEHCCVSKHVLYTHSRQPLLIFRWRIPKSKYIINLATLGVSWFNKDNVFALVINKNHYYQHRSVVCINNQYQNGRDYIEQDQPCTPCGLVYKTIPPSQNYITSHLSQLPCYNIMKEEDGKIYIRIRVATWQPIE